MHLYYTPASCSLAVHIALHEAGLGYTQTRVDLATHRTEDGRDFRAIHDRGYVPYLALDDGSGLGEVAAILPFLADQAPASGLAPAAGTRARLALAEWLAFVASEVHKPLGSLFDPTLHPDTRAATVARLGARLDTVVARLGARPWLLGDGFSAADGYLFTVLNWCAPLGVGALVTDRPALAAFQQRVAARPRVREALVAAGVVPG